MNIASSMLYTTERKKQLSLVKSRDGRFAQSKCTHVSSKENGTCTEYAGLKDLKFVLGLEYLP